MRASDGYMKGLGVSGSGTTSREIRGTGGQVEQLRVGQHVRVEGRDDVFVVLRVDCERLVADLLRVSKVPKLEPGVPLALLTVLAKPAENSNEGTLAG